MDLCLSCKACKTECPSSVDMAKLKTEFLAHYYDHHGVPFRAKLMGKIHQTSKIASAVAPLANLGMRTPLSRPIMNAAGIHPDRKMSPFVWNTFTKQWEKRQQNARKRIESRGPAVFFHDTFTTYNYPNPGMAAVSLLEAAGYDVILEERRACCGRPMLSKGLVDEARQVARKNVDVLARYARLGTPIVGVEPSCILTFREEYLDLLPGNEDVIAIAENSFMIDELLFKLHQEGTLGIEWKANDGPRVMFHGHCHQKALIGMPPSMTMLELAGCNASESGAGCCGMAGSFGYEEEHYEISRKIGEDRLFPAVENSSAQTIIAIAGVSCRQQIEHFTDRHAVHIAEVLADRIAPGHVWSEPKTVATAAD
jgi:Fe-S oxidoreductase